MCKGYVIAYDVGTSSVKAVLADKKLAVKAVYIRDYPIYNPQLGWAEQDPNDYWEAVVNATRGLVSKAKIDTKQIKAIAFSCQAMGIIPIDCNGEILHRNISWIDGRAESESVEINNILNESRYGPKSVMCKLLWLKRNRTDIYKKTKYFLDVNGFLKYKATGKCVFERTGACSYAYDFNNSCWDKEIFNIVGIDIQKLPPIVSASEVVGRLSNEAAKSMGLSEDVVVAAGCNDVEAAAIGSTSLGDGEGHIYLGSSAWICAAIMNRPHPGNGFTVSKSPAPHGYLLKGVMQSSGMTVDNAVKLLYNKELCDEETDVFEVIESEVNNINSGSDNLIITPWIYGETCPFTSESTRSTVFNFTSMHTRAHILNSIREGICFNLRWINEKMSTLYETNFSYLNIVGGGGLSNSWMQCLADIMQIPIFVTANVRHAGAIGAAICALIGAGDFKNFDEAKASVKIEKRYLPRENNKNMYTNMYEQFKELHKDLEIQYKQING